MSRWERFLDWVDPWRATLREYRSAADELELLTLAFALRTGATVDLDVERRAVIRCETCTSTLAYADVRSSHAGHRIWLLKRDVATVAERWPAPHPGCHCTNCMNASAGRGA